MKLLLLVLTSLLLVACDSSESANVTDNQQDESLVTPTETIAAQPQSSTQYLVTYKTVDWVDLIPKDDLEALLNPPSYVTDVVDGSLEDQITQQLQNSAAISSDDPYQQALVSTKVKAEMHDQTIRVPGFIVPLEFNEQQHVTQFFLVPFFGACIHVPPPPPNQIIFVTYADGLKLSSIYDPFWISGVLTTSIIENEMATSAYSMQMHSFEEYTEE